jgi:trigger factor
MATIERDNIGLLNDRITIRLSKEDYLPTFEKKVKEYSKSANIPGFRKGMVPTGLVKKMYGPSIFTDEVLKTVEKELRQYLQTAKPDIFAQPMAVGNPPEKMDFNNPDEYAFGFEIGLKPEFSIAPLKKAKLVRHVIEVTDAMVEKDIENLRQRAGQPLETKTVADKAAWLVFQFTELDAAGNPLENGLCRLHRICSEQFVGAVRRVRIERRALQLVDRSRPTETGRHPLHP